MEKPKKFDLIKIKWLDAETGNSWVDDDDLDALELSTVVTVGFLLKLPTKKYPFYIVASTVSFGDYKHYNATIDIPKAMVQTIEIITHYEEKQNGDQNQSD